MKERYIKKDRTKHSYAPNLEENVNITVQTNLFKG